MSITRKREPYVQYVYHFTFPLNSIDVRKITDSEIGICHHILKRYGKDNSHMTAFIQHVANEQNFKTVMKMFETHLPEELI